MPNFNQGFCCWRIKFKCQLRENREQSNAYRKLIEDGCEEGRLLYGLFLSSYLWPAETRVEQDLDDIVRHLHTTMKRLEAVAEEIEKSRKSQFIWIQTALHSDLQTRLSKVEEAMAGCRDALKQCAEMFTGLKPDLKDFLRATDQNAHYFSALARYARKATECWHDRTIGVLLVAAYAAARNPVAVSAEGFAKRAQRLRKSHPWMFCEECAPFNL